MDNSRIQTPGPRGDAAGFLHLVFFAFGAVVDVAGRRGSRIFELSRENVIMVIAGTVVVGFPLFFFMTLLPFWDEVGNFALIRNLNNYIAPAVQGVIPADGHDMSQFHLKRFLIASTSITEMILLSNFAALLSVRVRKHALLVWICYDRQKLLLYLTVSCVIFCGSWYLLFFDWTVLEFLSTGRRATRPIFYTALAMPFVTLVFGRLAAIAGLGAYRSASRKWRQPRKEFS